ncbi:MAG: hypothetical protein AAFX04_00310 [Pseudomonadota bacterium]
MKLSIVALATVSGLLIATPAAAQQDEDKEKPEQEVEENTETVKAKRDKITDRSHPDYVRCKSERVMGSLAKRKRTCMTNRQWEQAARDGNDLSREFLQQNQDGFLAGSN